MEKYLFTTLKLARREANRRIYSGELDFCLNKLTGVGKYKYFVGPHSEYMAYIKSITPNN